MECGSAATNCVVFFINVNGRCLINLSGPTVSVGTADVNGIRCVLYLSEEVEEVVTIIYRRNSSVVLSVLRCVECVGSSERRAAGVLLRRLSIGPCLKFTRSNLGMRRRSLPLPNYVDVRVFSMPCFSLVVRASAHLRQRFFCTVER